MKKITFITAALCLAVMTATAQTEKKKPFQLSFVSPLGTNGMQSHSTTNTVSINILGGHSYGNTAFEFGSIYNVNTHFTRGFQFAGVANYSGDTRNASQFAGVVNIASKGTLPFQFAGVVNIADEMKGLQIVGVSNCAKDARGLQFAGIFNVAGELSGVQFAGLVNVAKRVRGVQFGLINYAEESDGVSIGLVNIVKKGGKRELEVAFSEALNTSVSFKLGTDKFYTIFSGGVNYLGKTVDYAAGLGFGTHIDWKKGWGNQFEILGYSLTENGSFDTGDINMLTQLKFTVSKRLPNILKSLPVRY